MKIYYQNATSRRMKANVWVNGKQYDMLPGSHLDLKVTRDDKVTYKVGRLCATKPIKFQSPEAAFSIETDKKLQGIYMMALVALILVLWYVKQSNSLWVTILLIAAVCGYEVVSYYRGYIAKPIH
ncbi:hypothetical protein [Lacticaseibacillus jixiensis]|uniref:hypothetical protein n=1 Tax=Lacticaseibacillus jixiensis TaxID=3231926 RepID=UPI0036F22A8C